MTNLTELLERASDSDTPAPPIADDLARVHAVRRRQQRRRANMGLAGAAVLVIVGAGAAVTAPRWPSEDPSSTTATEKNGVTDDRIVLLSQPLEAGPYTFGKTPEGWRDLRYPHPEFAVVIGPEGGDDDPENFLGKLVIMMSTNPPAGEKVEYDGRAYWVLRMEDHTRITTKTRPGEPQAQLEIQYPDDAGWSQDLMLEFLSTVQVGQGAQPGVG